MPGTDVSMYVDRLPPLICAALSCHFLEKDETHSEGKHLGLHSSNVVQGFLNCCPSLSDELWQDAAQQERQRWQPWLYGTAPKPAEPASLTLTNSFGVSEVLLGLRVWLQLLTLIANVDPFVFHDLLRAREIGVRRDQNVT